VSLGLVLAIEVVVTFEAGRGNAMGKSEQSECVEGHSFLTQLFRKMENLQDWRGEMELWSPIVSVMSLGVEGCSWRFGGWRFLMFAFEMRLLLKAPKNCQEHWHKNTPLLKA
jgi:hypothetical protein